MTKDEKQQVDRAMMALRVTFERLEKSWKRSDPDDAVVASNAAELVERAKALDAIVHKESGTSEVL